MLEEVVRESHLEEEIFEPKKRQSEPRGGFCLTTRNISSKPGLRQLTHHKNMFMVLMLSLPEKPGSVACSWFLSSSQEELFPG
jgi:hypothetical protein